MESKPHADPMLVRLILLFFCSKENEPSYFSLSVEGKTEKVSSSDARRKALAVAFVAALRLGSCESNSKEPNCQTLSRYLRLKKTLQMYFEPLDEDHPPSPDASFADGESESVTSSELEDLRQEIEDDTEADVTFGELILYLPKST